MSNRIEVTPEMVKLSQQRSRLTGTDVRQEMARHIAQEAILMSDPELGLIIDEDEAYSREDALVSAFEVNDLVVDGLRLDIRVLGEDGYVGLPRHLLGTRYMKAGSLVVSINKDRTANLVAFIPAEDWEKQESLVGGQDKVLLRADKGKDLDLETTLSNLPKGQSKNGGNSKQKLGASQFNQFLATRSDMPLDKQRELVDACLADETSWSELKSATAGYSKAFVRKTLTQASIWNYRLERISETLIPRFKKLSKEEIKAIIAKTGEKYGGQPESAQFRRELIKRLSAEELGKSLSGESLKRAAAAVDDVLSGKAVKDAVESIVKSNVAVEMALAIRQQRNKLMDFVDASSQELSGAFRQLSLQPVYATHSQESGEGLEAINEALKLVYAAELAESLKELEQELSAV